MGTASFDLNIQIILQIFFGNSLPPNIHILLDIKDYFQFLVKISFTPIYFILKSILLLYDRHIIFIILLDIIQLNLLFNY